MNSQYWDKLIANFPDPHILQTSEWAKVKGFNGWNPIPVVWTSNGQEYIGDRISSTMIKPDLISAGTLVHERMISIPGIGRKLRIMYAPKGPLL